MCHVMVAMTGGLEHNPAGTLCGLMPTDSTEDDDSSTVDGGFTQAWDTVGAGKTNPRLRELI